MKAEQKRTIFLLNDYPMRSALDLVEQGLYGGQHLWGMWELRDRYTWVIAPWSFDTIAKRVPRTERILWKVMAVLGDLVQQAHVIWSLPAAHRPLIYAADQQSIACLALLRRAHILRVPVVMMLHNGPRNSWGRFWMRGIDRFVALDDVTAASVAGIARISPTPMPWGPSMSSPLYEGVRRSVSPRLDFVAAGRTNRFYDALRTAAEDGALNGVILSDGAVDRYVDGALHRTRERISHREYLDLLGDSRWSAILLDDPQRLSGLTEAVDALALGVPILVSDSPKFPYRDLGCVRMVDERRPSEILKAIKDAERQEWMGTEPPMSMTAFAKQLERVFEEL